MSRSAIFRPRPNVVSAELDDVVSSDQGDAGSVLLDLKTRRYYSLNEVGTRIWQLLKEGDSVEGIAAALQEGWEVEGAEAEAHVQAFIEELSREGLIEETRASSSE